MLLCNYCYLHDSCQKVWLHLMFDFWQLLSPTAPLCFLPHYWIRWWQSGLYSPGAWWKGQTTQVPESLREPSSRPAPKTLHNPFTAFSNHFGPAWKRSLLSRTPHEMRNEPFHKLLVCVVSPISTSRPNFGSGGPFYLCRWPIHSISWIWAHFLHGSNENIMLSMAKSLLTHPKLFRIYL